MQKALIYGAGQMARQIFAFWREHQDNQYEILGFIDDSVELAHNGNYTHFGGIEVLRTKYFGVPNNICVFLAIGYNDLARRLDRYQELSSLGYMSPNLIHPRTSIDTDVQLGSGNVLLAGVAIGTGVNIGNANFFDAGVIISHDNSIGNGNFLCLQSGTGGFTTIGDSNFLGMQSGISDGCTVGNRNYISAKSFVYRNIESDLKFLSVFNDRQFPMNPKLDPQNL